MDKPDDPNLGPGGPIVLYGVPIQQAIASGDLERMRSLAQQAEQHLAEHGNVSAALEALKVEIAKLEGGGDTGGPLPPYGVAIQQAVASGDLDRMRAVAQEAEAHVSDHGDLSASLESLKTEIRKLEG